MAVLGADRSDVAPIVGGSGSEDRQVGIEEHGGVEVARIEMRCGSFDHAGDAIDAFTVPAHCGEVASGQAGTSPLVRPMLRLVDGVVIERCGNDDAEVCDRLVCREVANVAKNRLDVFDPVVAALALPVPADEPLEQRRITADVGDPGNFDDAGNVLGVAVIDDDPLPTAFVARRVR